MNYKPYLAVYVNFFIYFIKEAAFMQSWIIRDHLYSSTRVLYDHDGRPNMIILVQGTPILKLSKILYILPNFFTILFNEKLTL